MNHDNRMAPTVMRLLALLAGLAWGCDGELDAEAVRGAIESNGGSCDVDGDGSDAQHCGGDDCDDRDPTRGPDAEEACNGWDDDCDGRIDEGLGLGAPCEAFAGACRRAGVIICGLRGVAVCDAAPGDASPEVCNGVDDDCNGAVDEGFAAGEPCVVGVGLCRREGAVACISAYQARCDATPGPAVAERCDALDNDCDGISDEGFGLGEPCAVGVGACRSEGQWACADDGEVACDATPEPPSVESCDGRDDDCDGAVDHDPNGPDERRLEGAACHGCLLIAESSCEWFYRHLDRALVVPVLGKDPSWQICRQVALADGRACHLQGWSGLKPASRLKDTV